MLFTEMNHHLEAVGAYALNIIEFSERKEPEGGTASESGPA